jgi:hypothetical protein
MNELIAKLIYKKLLYHIQALDDNLPCKAERYLSQILYMFDKMYPDMVRNRTPEEKEIDKLFGKDFQELLPYYLEIIELESSTKFLLDRQLELYNEK